MIFAMALELLITFRDPKRKSVFHPFCFQVVLYRSWWPLARRLGLPLLQRLETLDIRDRVEAEALVRELGIAREALTTPAALDIAQEEADYMLKRIDQVVPLIRDAIRDWDYVDCISL
jgi:hypothetical protein